MTQASRGPAVPQAELAGEAGVSDVELLNQGMLWAATTPAAANEAFNMAKGDISAGSTSGR